jgi:hypothetical protein
LRPGGGRLRLLGHVQSPGLGLLAGDEQRAPELLGRLHALTREQLGHRANARRFQELVLGHVGLAIRQRLEQSGHERRLGRTQGEAGGDAALAAPYDLAEPAVSPPEPDQIMTNLETLRRNLLGIAVG